MEFGSFFPFLFLSKVLGGYKNTYNSQLDLWLYVLRYCFKIWKSDMHFVAFNFSFHLFMLVLFTIMMFSSHSSCFELLSLSSVLSYLMYFLLDLQNIVS